MKSIVALIIAASSAACTPGDDAFVALEALDTTASPELGIPVRVTVHGGTGVEVEVVQGVLAGGHSRACLIPAGTSTVLLVYPDDVEALVLAAAVEECTSRDAALAATSQLAVSRARNESDTDCTVPDAGPDETVDASKSLPVTSNGARQ
jgi:hypothetical protein